MKISIVMPTLNNGDSLRRAIESVASQSHHDIELIVVDGGSTDSSIEHLTAMSEQHPGLIKWVSEPDSGVYNALNKGIAMASGDIIGTLHGNDLYMNPDVLSRVAEAFAADSRLPFVFGDVHYFSPSGQCVRLYSGPENPERALRYGIAPPHPSLFMRREVLDRVGLYRVDYIVAADFEMFVRLILVEGYTGLYIPLDMVGMSLGGLSTRLSNRLLTNNLEKMRALRENGISRTGLGALRRYFYTLFQ